MDSPTSALPTRRMGSLHSSYRHQPYPPVNAPRVTATGSFSQPSLSPSDENEFSEGPYPSQHVLTYNVPSPAATDILSSNTSLHVNVSPSALDDIIERYKISQHCPVMYRFSNQSLEHRLNDMFGAFLKMQDAVSLVINDLATLQARTKEILEY
ncbi:hypothetical protein CERSUDRAFT_101465, partial [Gelatoporia subvermispora B]